MRRISPTIRIHLFMNQGACTLQFRSLRNRDMLSIAMPKPSVATKTPRAPAGSRKSARAKEQEEGAAAAELALKAHALESDSEILAEMTDGDRMMREMADTIDLTEAPEDAVASLVIDLLHYCEREKIDWNHEVMARARKHFRSERVYESQK
jgi:hypothetical protein